MRSWSHARGCVRAYVRAHSRSVAEVISVSGVFAPFIRLPYRFKAAAADDDDDDDDDAILA